MSDTKVETLHSEVSNESTVHHSVKTLVIGLKNWLNELAQHKEVSPEDVQKISDKLNPDQLAIAVTQGTGTPAVLGSSANPDFGRPVTLGGTPIITNPVKPTSVLTPGSATMNSAGGTVVDYQTLVNSSAGQNTPDPTAQPALATEKVQVFTETTGSEPIETGTNTLDKTDELEAHETEPETVS
jgi:hypothetical protein